MSINKKKFLKIFIITSLLSFSAFLSCDFSDIYDDSSYQIFIIINCTGGTGTNLNFNWDLIADDTPRLFEDLHSGLNLLLDF